MPLNQSILECCPFLWRLSQLPTLFANYINLLSFLTIICNSFGNGLKGNLFFFDLLKNMICKTFPLILFLSLSLIFWSQKLIIHEFRVVNEEPGHFLSKVFDIIKVFFFVGWKGGFIGAIAGLTIIWWEFEKIWFKMVILTLVWALFLHRNMSNIEIDTIILRSQISIILHFMLRNFPEFNARRRPDTLSSVPLLFVFQHQNKCLFTFYLYPFLVYLLFMPFRLITKLLQFPTITG